MKKPILIILMALIASATVYAEEISELFQEFQRRDAIVFTKDEVKVLSFLTGLNYEINNVVKLEFVSESKKQFVIESRNGDVCLGDMSIDLLRCKNNMGVTTINYAGDAD